LLLPLADYQIAQFSDLWEVRTVCGKARLNTEALPDKVVKQYCDMLRKSQQRYAMKLWGIVRNDSVRIDTVKIARQLSDC